jgi:hypothetical protein
MSATEPPAGASRTGDLATTGAAVEPDGGMAAEPSGGVAVEPVARAELELALRAAHLAIAELREDLHALAAQVVALTERGGEAAAEAVAARAELLRAELALSDERAAGRLRLGAAVDKYGVAEGDGPPCAELLPLCGARCCTFEVALSSQDLDEGGLRWDYAAPYLLAKRGDGQCVHHDGRGCAAYGQRPATCRSYDCRSDARVWLDYPGRVLAPRAAPGAAPSRGQLERDVRDRQLATFVEASRLRRR